MKTPPIGFTQDNFCAVLNSTKTETRRLSNGSDKPRYAIGDRCYLTEPTQILAGADYTNKKLRIQYFWHTPEPRWVVPTEQDLIKINNRKSGAYSRQIPRFMFKSFARYWVEIADVKLERLLDITADAVIAEGIKYINCPELACPVYFDYMAKSYHYKDPILSYLSEIEHLHGKAIADSNPWMWAYKFKLIGETNDL